MIWLRVHRMGANQSRGAWKATAVSGIVMAVEVVLSDHR